ncbi:MAG: hypothetical protein UZ21_OP11001000976 [Microgenomates bacterium OLB22]|nr:MAG: hypothetical protein UZ21_OP11001000976 [Microgenomates bacterium OLB22]
MGIPRIIFLSIVEWLILLIILVIVAVLMEKTTLALNSVAAPLFLLITARNMLKEY